jgi:hypothetical protein
MSKTKNNGLKYNPTFRFVWVTFDEEKIEKDQDKLNKSISQGYQIVQEYPTSTGVVFSLMKNMRNHGEMSNQKVMEDYGFESKVGGLQK